MPGALKSTFMAELLSMNLLMAGMMPTMMILSRRTYPLLTTRSRRTSGS